jgi:hypothetical protein
LAFSSSQAEKKKKKHKEKKNHREEKKCRERRELTFKFSFYIVTFGSYFWSPVFALSF